VKRFKYKKKEKHLSDKKLIKYLNKLGKKGWSVISILKYGALIRGKRKHVIIVKKELW